MYFYFKGDKTKENLVGGKSYKLSLLNQFNVPDWIAVSCLAFNEHFNKDWLNLDNESIRNEILKIELKPSFSQELESSLGRFNDDVFFAVRSSAIGEDGKEFSFAGQMSSFLYVRKKDIAEHIKKVWASAFSDHIIEYRKVNNINEINVAVLIQIMINSEVSGVAFGLNPISGNKNEFLISSVFGLGEGLVSGELDADTYSVLKQYDQNASLSFQIEQDITEKSSKFIFNEDKQEGIIKVNNKEKDLLKSSLSKDQILELSENIEKLNSLFSFPQDIEWAYENNELFILQSRPLTSINNLANKSDIKLIWDNSNIVESYAGITLPLTFSFIKNIYTEVYKEFCNVMGVEQEIIEANNRIFAMLGSIKGRVYYNLYNWYQVLSLLPGYSINAEFMEQMMGVKEKMEINPSTIQSSKNKYLRLVKLIFGLIRNFRKLPKGIKEFYQITEVKLKYESPKYLESKTPSELKDYYYDLERSLLKKWQAPLINDFFAMIFYGILKKLLEKWDIDSKGTLQNDLLCGEGDIISTAPIKSIRLISNLILDDKKLMDLFNKENDEILNYINNNSNDEIVGMINKHLKLYGDRCVNELKLETITPRHEPVILIRLIKSYLLSGKHDFDKESKNKNEIRDQAEKIVFAKIKSPIKKVFFKFILKHSRNLVKNRENLRFERTRLYSKIREIFLGISSNFVIDGIINDSKDIFYLSKEEIFDFISGESVDIDLKTTIEKRKELYQSFEIEEPADRFSSYGTVNYANDFKEIDSELEDANLEGIGCCSGVIKAPVRFVTDPNNAPDLSDCIMIAEKTDPGWVPLFPIAKAIIVERGSLLSHSAIVAREMGIPAIVSVKGLMKKLIDGETVEMDGSSGKIKLFREEDV